MKHTVGGRYDGDFQANTCQRQWQIAHHITHATDLSPRQNIILSGYKPDPFHPGVFLSNAYGAAFASTWQA
jgi:hypothetical protein